MTGTHPARAGIRSSVLVPVGLSAMAAAFSLWLLGWPSTALAQTAAMTEVEIREEVVLLHGLGRRASSMELLASRLRDAGFVVHNLAYSSRQGDPATLLAELSVKIEACCAHAERLHFVGHSLGGILARAHIARSRPQGLGRVIMLSSPNQGSEIVDALGETWLFQAIMGPTSRHLGTSPDSLPNQLPPPDYELGVIAATASINPLGSWLIPGDDDGMVSVCRMQLEGMVDFMTVDRTHAFIMRGPEVAEQIVIFLRTGQFGRDAGATSEVPVCE